jgi:hypothetical protein
MRENVRGVLPMLDAVADGFLSIRPEGGRFFIDERGAFYKSEHVGDPGAPFVPFQTPDGAPLLVRL